MHSYEFIREIDGRVKKLTDSYPPLGADEEFAMIASLKGSDRGRLNDMLVLHNLRFAIEVAKKYTLQAPSYVSADDVMMDAFAGLSKAAQEFDVDSGVRFTTYAGYWVEAFCRSRSRRVSHLTDVLTSVSMDDIVPGQDRTVDCVINAISMLDVDDDPDRAYVDAALDCETVVAAIGMTRRLNRKQRDIVRRIYRDGASAADIAREMGCSREYIRQVSEASIDKIRLTLRRDLSAEDDPARYGPRATRGLAKHYELSSPVRRAARLVRKRGCVYKVEWRISGGGGAYFHDLPEFSDHTTVKSFGVEEDEPEEIRYNHTNILRFINGRWRYVQNSKTASLDRVCNSDERHSAPVGKTEVA